MSIHSENQENGRDIKGFSNINDDDHGQNRASVLTQYDLDKLTSEAYSSQNCTIPVNIFEFIHSYGYDCRRPFNLCACDESVVAWAAGSYMTFLNVRTHQISFRRSSTGGSIGSITVNQMVNKPKKLKENYCNQSIVHFQRLNVQTNVDEKPFLFIEILVKNPCTERNHIAVAEGGVEWAKPLIIIYVWPSLTPIAVLKKGTQHSYAHLNYSPDGKLLASLGGAPDYYLTIWDWQSHCIILRATAFSDTVYNVRFSPYIDGQLTTSGASHIKFWKMAPTFTCLKLKGELGRFGKTEICDVIGILPMPDEKVISGCSWGNILVWEEGLVKMEVCRKGRRTCHSGPITQILRSPDTGEVTTIATDGHICSWYWETVEQADLPENDPFVELNPVSEIFIPDAQLMTISSRKQNEWFAQDANGSIWAISLDNECGAGAAEAIDSRYIERVVKSHGGAVVGLVSLRNASLLASLGCDGTLLVHSAPRGPLILATTCPNPAASMIYLPPSVDPEGRTLILGFIDGSIRVLSLNIKLLILHEKQSDEDNCVILLQSLKPHTKTVNVISVNNKGSLVVTASLDSTIFVYQITSENSNPNLTPLCYIPTLTVINSICWKPGEELKLLMAGQNCYVMEAELPLIDCAPASENIISFRQEFISLLTAQLKDYRLRYKPEEEENEQYLDEDNSSLSDQEDKPEEKFQSHLQDIELISENGTSSKAIVWAKYDPNDVDFIWTAQEGCGCLLRVQLHPDGSALDRFAPLHGAWDITVTSHIFMNDNKFSILGMGDGELRIMKMSENAEEISDAEFAKKTRQRRKYRKIKYKTKDAEPEAIPKLDFNDFLRLPMHNSITGAVTLMEVSSCQNYFFTAGNDGNIFSYKNNFKDSQEKKLYSASTDAETDIIAEVIDEFLLKDIIELSHEETAKEKEQNTLLSEAAEHKKIVLSQLDVLKKEFKELLKKNEVLPASQKVEMKCDPRTLEQLSAELDARLRLVKRKLAHPLAVSNLKLSNFYHQNIEPLDVFPFQLNSILKDGFIVRTIRQKKLDEEFYKNLDELRQKIEEASLRTQNEDLFDIPQKSMEVEESSEETQAMPDLGSVRAPAILEGLPSTVPPPRALARALRDYLNRLERQHRQHFEWQEHMGKRVIEDIGEEEESGASAALREAEATIGEYRLKSTDDGTTRPPDPRATYHTALCTFITRLEIFEIQHEYNKSLMELREEKSLLVKNFGKLTEELASIRRELPKDLARSPPFPAPSIDHETEYPDKNLEVHVETVVKAESSFCLDDEKLLDPNDEEIIMSKDPALAYWEMVKNDPTKEEFNTPRFKEYKKRRTSSLLARQEEIVREMKRSVDQWEEKLKGSSAGRERVMLKAHFLKLHLLRLTREQLILDAFKSKETELIDQVRLKQSEAKSVQDHAKMLQKNMELQKSSVSLLQEQIKRLEVQHRQIAGESRFITFLRRIYRKKQKPQKLNVTGSSSDSSGESESESPESESEDESESDSEEGGLGRMRLDSTACPPGCNPQHFEQTVQLRDLRHELENQIKEQERLIEISRKEIENSHKQAKAIISGLEQRQKDLKDVMREKQSRLNEIPCVVVLSGDRCSAEALFQLSKEEGGECKDGILVFPALTIFRLRERIQHLHGEAEHHKKRKSINKQHLRFLRVDCKNMENRVSELRTSCSEVLSRKLPGTGAESGSAVAASRALDAVLASMTRAFKMEAASGLTADMLDQLAHRKKKECELAQKHCAALQGHTHKLRVAAALQAELYTYQGLEKAEEPTNFKRDAEYRQDLVRLRRIRKEQQRQIEDLRSEVQKLKLKPASSGRDMLPPLASSDVTSAPDTPPSTKLIAAALARSLKEVGIGRHSNPRSDSALLDNIARIVPSLISGKINANEAMEEIIKSFSPRSSAEALRRPRQTIVDILGQITQQNLELGARSSAEIVGREDRGVSGSSLGSSASVLENVLRTLCEEAKSADDTDAIDSAVAALLELHPNVISHRIDVDEVTRTLFESFEDSYEEDCLKGLVTAVAECLAAQSTAPAEAAEVARECFQEIERHTLQRTDSPSAGSQSASKSKRVSLADDSDASSTMSAAQITATVSTKPNIENTDNSDT